MRTWTIHLLNSSHMDPGWHDLPARVLAQSAVNLDTIVAFCEQTRDNPLAQRFLFTMEHALVVDYYERHRPAEQFQRFLACCKRGQIEIGAIYAGVHTDLCGREELARLTTYATGLRRRYGLRIDSALLNDVSEGYTMGLPQVLARSGIKSLCMGPGVKAISEGIQPDLPRIFFWQTPDESQVLVCWTPGYWTYSDWKAGFEGEETLQDFEHLAGQGVYPYHAFFRHIGGGDNAPPSLEVLKRVHTFQEQFPDQVFRLSRVDEFTAALSSAFAEAIPTFQGDNPSSWADGTISLAKETALHREAQRAAITGETLATLAQMVGTTVEYPTQAFTEIYRNLHFYSDHTWGLDLDQGLTAGAHLERAVGHDGNAQTSGVLSSEMDVNDPIFDEWRASWDAKKVYAHDAHSSAHTLQQRQIQALNGSIPASTPQFVAWNPTSWIRSDLVRAPWPQHWPTEGGILLDARDNKEIPWQRDRDPDGQPQLIFLARDLPALGYACFLPQEHVVSLPEKRNEEISPLIENQFYRVRLNPDDGTVQSLWDKRLQVELVDQEAHYGFNQYLHADVNDSYEGTGTVKKAGIAHGEGIRFIPDALDEIVCEHGPVSSRLRVRRRLTQGPAPVTLIQTILLHEDCPWIDVVNEVEKTASLRKEQIYFAFPFAIPGPISTHIELPYAVMQWERDILPSCWRGYSSCQSWVDMSGKTYGVTWSSLDAPVICVGDITSNEWDPAWHRDYVPQQGHLYSYVMSNIWNCNYALWQGGAMQFRYRFTSHSGKCDPASATRFGWEHAAPVLSDLIAAQSGTLPATQFSMLQVEPANVVVAALKRAEDGNGWVLRLYETGGQSETTCRLRIPGLSVSSATLTTLAEEDLERLPLEGQTLTLPIKANELVSVRLQ